MSKPQGVRKPTVIETPLPVRAGKVRWSHYTVWPPVMRVNYMLVLGSGLLGEEGMYLGLLLEGQRERAGC